MAALKLRAELLTVVNMAYEAPSEPVGHRCTLRLQSNSNNFRVRPKKATSKTVSFPYIMIAIH